MNETHESRAREFLGTRAEGIPESTYLRSVLELVQQAERLEKATSAQLRSTRLKEKGTA